MKNTTYAIALVAAFMMAGSAFASDMSSTMEAAAPAHQYGITPSFGIAQNNYNVGSMLTQTALVGQINYNHDLSSVWGINADLSSTLSAFHNNDMNQATMYFINADLLASYNVMNYNAWDLKIFGGAAYRTTAANSKINMMGLGNVYEAQFQPMISKALGRGANADIYAKINPIYNNNGGIASISSNHEYTLGAGYAFAKDTMAKNMMISAEWSSMQMTNVDNKSMTMGLAYSL